MGNSNKFELLLFTGIILFAKAKPSFSTKVLFNVDFEFQNIPYLQLRHLWLFAFHKSDYIHLTIPEKR
ncbi:hypothetical protein [Acinetobacter sp. TUM15113]|uniref:hypothetical protein n=1 Tax=Acinetobacter sp. TUM15113 TaxID=2609140 RepID=UPI00124E5680|nr:hypothetical protein [Acinetobacter sp. TUM15113]